MKRKMAEEHNWKSSYRKADNRIAEWLLAGRAHWNHREGKKVEEVAVAS